MSITSEIRCIRRISGLMEALNVSRPTAMRLAHTPGFPAIWLGERNLIVPVDALNAWLAEQAGKN